MITVLGSINLDLVATTPRLPKAGETLSGTGFAMSAGGKGANQALAALRAGAHMRLVGAVGADGFAEPALAELRAEGADLSGVRQKGTNTGIALILVDGRGENVIVIIAGANGLVDAAMAQDAIGAMKKGDLLVLQQEIPAPTLHEALDGARALGLRSLLNIAPFSAESGALADKADILVANETEFSQLTGAPETGDGLIEAVRSRALGAGQIVVVTLGRNGVIAASESGAIVQLSAEKITPVDTVGAGDTFCGYLAAGLDQGLALDAALRRANRAAAQACLGSGAQASIPRAGDIGSFFA